MQWQAARQRKQHARRGDEAADRHDGAAGEALRHPPGDRRADRADRVDQEDQARGSHAQAERRGGEPEPHHVVDPHERAHAARSDPVERQQPRVGYGPPEHPRQLAGSRGHRGEVARRGQRERHGAGAQQPEQGDRRQRPAPAGHVGHRAGEQAAGHPAEGVAADVESRRAGVGVGMQFLAQVGGGGGRQPGQRDALHQPQDEEPAPAGSDGAGQCDDAGRDRPRSG